jgi:hypothetical protein
MVNFIERIVDEVKREKKNQISESRKKRTLQRKDRRR